MADPERIGLPSRVARRVALAMSNRGNANVGVYAAMDTFYATGTDRGHSISQFLAADKAQVAAAVRRLRNPPRGSGLSSTILDLA